MCIMCMSSVKIMLTHRPGRRTYLERTGQAFSVSSRRTGSEDLIKLQAVPFDDFPPYLLRAREFQAWLRGQEQTNSSTGIPELKGTSETSCRLY